MNAKTYEKELLREMRTIAIPMLYTTKRPTGDNLARAVTLNENLKSFGYCLKPDDIYYLATTGEAAMEELYRNFKDLIDEVKAEPMYPDFPLQVMAMDEAQFRMHQLIHYFSTYGIEFLFDTEVERGWLPDVESTEKILDDDTLLDVKVLNVIFEDDIFIKPVNRILAKKERMTLPELDILRFAINCVPLSEIDSMTIPFKENIPPVFLMVADNAELSTESKIYILKSICQHSGDVWRCLGEYLREHNYRLKTSQKKLMVKLFEEFPIEDFQANLYLSKLKGSQIIRKLEFLSFNRFCRSAAHKEAVRKLRNGELQSWNGKVEELLKTNMQDALNFIAERPGMLVRLTARLLRLGMDPVNISNKLNERASSLSMQTLITLLNHFSLPSVREERADAMQIYAVMWNALHYKMRSIDTPLFGKKVFIDEGGYLFDHSYVDMNKSSEGGYIRSGIAYKIPDDVNILRFFVYWDDDRRIDIDLHCMATDIHDKIVHVGWNAGYNENGITHSGDITHSDAAEYVDINLNKTDVKDAVFEICSYTRVPFNEIDTCFTGMLAVSKMREDVKLYNPKNCFFSHNLRSSAKDILYCSVDVEHRVMTMIAKNLGGGWRTSTKKESEVPTFSLQNYLWTLFAAQNVERVDTREEADIVLVMGNTIAENEVSIIDSNFFCD